MGAGVLEGGSQDAHRCLGRRHPGQEQHRHLERARAHYPYIHLPFWPRALVKSLGGQGRAASEPDVKPLEVGAEP